MAAVMERNKAQDAVVSRAISEAAAARAVDDVIIAMINSGFSPDQAKGIAYATQEFLVGESGYFGRAEQALSSAGFPREAASVILNEISGSISHERAA